MRHAGLMTVVAIAMTAANTSSGFVISSSMLPRAPALRGRTTMSSSTSMGDVWSDIEHLRRLLDENRLQIKEVVKRQAELNGRNLGGEYDLLQRTFVNHVKREDELRVELARLITIALRIQLRGGRGRPGGASSKDATDD